MNKRPGSANNTRKKVNIVMRRRWIDAPTKNSDIATRSCFEPLATLFAFCGTMFRDVRAAWLHSLERPPGAQDNEHRTLRLPSVETVPTAGNTRPPRPWSSAVRMWHQALCRPCHVTFCVARRLTDATVNINDITRSTLTKVLPTVAGTHRSRLCQVRSRAA